MKKLRCLTTLMLVWTWSTAWADWPQFLGPDGAARSGDTAPIRWDDRTNLAWKVDLPGTGSSSPIIKGERIFITCYAGDSGQPMRQLLCLNRRDGTQEWTLEFPIDYTEDRYQGFITEHGYASNTPVVDKDHLYAFFGKGGVHCVSLEGQLKWSVDVGKASSNRRWGSAASLLLYKDTVIVNAAEEAGAIVCLNKATGDEVWKQEAGMLELTYATPRLVKGPRGDELVIGVPGEIWSLNPTTGKLQWYAATPSSGNVSPSLILDGDRVYGFGGFRDSGSIAVEIGGNTDPTQKDVTDTRVLWTNRSTSYVATPLLVDNRLYWIDDRGIAYCTSTKDGEIIYRERVGDLASGRPVYASPVLIGDHIYVVTRRSGTLVYQPGTEFEIIARNQFDGDETDFNASPAVAGKSIYLRSDQSLYCISED